MLRKITLLSLLVFGFISLVWIFELAVVRKEDIVTYKNIKKSQELSKTPQAYSSSAHQTRTQVRKDLWIAQEDGARLQTRIASAYSTLELHPKERNFEIVEHLHKIHVWMQDRLYAQGNTPMQQMRYLEADSGVYHYATQQFVAESVSISLFSLPGHTLAMQQNTSPFIRGVAQDVIFSVSGKGPQFQAKNFKANFTKGAKESL